MKSILITGGAGFIGSHVSEFFAKREDFENIVVIDNLSRGKLLNKDTDNQDYNWEFLKQYDKIKLYNKDVRNIKFLRKLFSEIKFNVVIHTAAQTAVTTSIKEPSIDFDNNAVASFNLLETVRKCEQDPVMILCSTNKVFGNNINQIQISEKKTRYTFGGKYTNGINEEFSIDLCEHTPYGASKLCSDLYFQEYGHLYNLKTAVFRMSCIYGTRQFGVEDQGWVAHFIISAIKNKKIRIFGDGKQVRDILFISDLINAYDAYIDKAGKLKNQVFCMGGGMKNTISLIELIEVLENKLNKKIKHDFYDWRPSDQKVYISDISKAKKLLSWKPNISPEEGIDLLVDWVKEKEGLFH